MRLADILKDTLDQMPLRHKLLNYVRRRKFGPRRTRKTLNK